MESVYAGLLAFAYVALIAVICQIAGKLPKGGK